MVFACILHFACMQKYSIHAHIHECICMNTCIPTHTYRHQEEIAQITNELEHDKNIYMHIYTNICMNTWTHTNIRRKSPR